MPLLAGEFIHVHDVVIEFCFTSGTLCFEVEKGSCCKCRYDKSSPCMNIDSQKSGNVLFFGYCSLINLRGK